MNTILAIVVVLTLSGSPVKHATVSVEGMKWDHNNGEPVTDSRGHFVVEVKPGSLHTSVTKGEVTWYGARIYEKGKPVIVVLEIP